MNLITVDMLLENNKKIENKPKKIKVEIVELKGILELDVLERSEILDIWMSKETDKDAEIIYTAGSIFKDDVLIQKLNCKTNPIEVVGKVLKPGTIKDLADLILKKAGFEKGISIKEIDEDIKN